jgi:PAS domain S-box-containing protein
MARLHRQRLGGGNVSRSSPLWPSLPRVLLYYAVAVLAVAAAVLAGLAVDRFLQTAPFVSLFLCAVLLSAWLGGIGPGLFATGLSILAFDYFFITPVHSLLVGSGGTLRIALFAITALFVVWVSAAQKRTAESLRRARDELRATVAELEKLNTSLRAENAERMRAERELQVTIDTIPALAARYRRDGSLDFVNQTWRTYTGLSQDSLQGERWGVAIHPDDLPKVEAAWRAHLPSGRAFQMEQRLRRADGEYRWHWVRRVPLHDENGEVIRWYGVGHDIEDQKRAERALQRSETYLAEAQRLSSTGSFARKIASGELFWSKETYRIMEFDETVKPTISLVLQRVHPDDRKLLQQQLDRAAQSDQDYEYEGRLLMPDGDIKHMHVRAHRHVSEAGEEEVVGAVMDVTATRKAQEELQIAQTALAHVTRVTMLGEMSASIAHEVSQPLAAIVSNGEAGLRWLRRERPDTEEARAAIEHIVSDAHRATEVIRRIREFSKKADPQMVQLDLNEVVEEAVALVRHEALRHDVAMRLELAPGLPPVRGDRIQLQQVLINFLVNGMEAMATVRDQERVLITRTKRDRSDRVLVAVEDAGIGIAPEDAKRLFTAFHTTKPDGLGMGLSICRSIVEAHGGRVWASGNAGPGTTFQFTISADGRPDGASASDD